MQYIEIEKDKLPISFDISLGTELFNFEVHYNEREDLFTVTLSTLSDGILVRGEPLIYGLPLFEDMRDVRYPILTLVPKDEMMEIGEVTYDNFGEKVFLAVVE